MKLQTVVLTGTLLALPSLLQAQSPSFTGHYVPGVEGIKGASLPPPGFYLRDYNVFYTADRYNLPNGHEASMDFDAFVYANVIRGIWVSDWQVLGGNFVMDAMVPLISTDLEVNGRSDSEFGFGDIYVEPAAIAWHGTQWDAALGYSLWMPTGESKPNSAEPGKGFWGQMLTAGGTVYFDAEKTWALSLLNRYEFNQEEDSSDITPGDQWTLEFGISKSVMPTVEVGLVGYYQLQTTKDSGTNASRERDQVLAFGPEVSVLCPQLGLFTSLRYNFEVLAEDRPQGQTITLTLTKAF
ncbi:MAG: transporter [Verrucomicrobia bacterium]|nr:transporter [Verrucomicrobiota bacterium]